MCVFKVKDIERDIQRISEVSASSTRNLRRINVAMLALFAEVVSNTKPKLSAIGHFTHKIPRLSTKETVNFFWAVILTDQIIGIGIMAYIQSLIIVMTDIEYAAATKESPDTHFAG
jgi:hypothetical protein